MFAVVCAALVAGTGVASSGAAAAPPPGRLGHLMAPMSSGTFATALRVSPDRRLVIAGVSGTVGYSQTTFLRAFGPELRQDSSFGTGGELRFDPDFRNPVAFEIEPDGQILLVRSGNPPTLYRFNRDGTQDGSFGAGGTIDLDFGAAWVYSVGLALYPDGRILVAGSAYAGEGQPPFPLHLRRYLPNGSPDEGFGSHGHVEQPAVGPGGSGDVALQRSGGILLRVASYDAPFAIMRFTEDGRRDASFGRDGIAEGLGRRRWEPHVHPAGPFVTSGGRIRIPITYGERESVMRLGIVGLTAGGRVDRRFGRQGLALGPRRPYTEGGEAASAAVLDAHGSLLIAGSLSHADDLSGDDAAIVRRFRPNGALDRSFGRHGRLELRGDSSTLSELIALTGGETGVLAVQHPVDRYGQLAGGVLRTFGAGYDRAQPAIRLTAGCHLMRIRVRDLSALDRAVVRVGGRVVRRTRRKRLRLRVRPGLHVSVTAVDVAGNAARARTTVPRC